MVLPFESFRKISSPHRQIGDVRCLVPNILSTVEPKLVNFLGIVAFGLINFGTRMMSLVGAAVGKNHSMAIKGSKIKPLSNQVYRKESRKGNEEAS